MFYTFRQNNSRASYMRDSYVTTYVIIEASSAAEANELAVERAHIYFDGARDGGPDCRCCGSRWYRVYEKDGTETPTVYGEHVEDLYLAKWTPQNMNDLRRHDRRAPPGMPEIYVYYKNSPLPVGFLYNNEEAT